VRGAVTGPIGTAGVTPFANPLPVAPTQAESYPIAADTALGVPLAATASISTGGVLTVVGSVTGASFNLDNIDFLTD
jgi:hypothetical protein